MKFTLSAKERLKSRKAIGRLFKSKRSVGAFPLRFFYLKNSEDQQFPLQAAFSVSKKHFKKAVDRNRLKRLMREAYRLNKLKLNLFLEAKELKISGMWVFVGPEKVTFVEMQKALVKTIDRLILELSDKIDS
jgi:ribonuclease P protein component